MTKEYRSIELTEHGTFKSYTLGTLLALFFTLASFAIVYFDLLSPLWMIISISLFAIIQASVLLAFFLNLGKESKPRWNLLIFLFMVLVTVIIVFGSLWIMYHLDYNLMPSMSHS